MWLAWLLLAVAGHAAAVEQPYYFTRINGRTSGLAQNSVHVLFQGRQGYIWIGTKGGLNRFDGYTLERHGLDPSRADGLPTSWMSAITNAEDDNLWLGTPAGLLLHYDPVNRRVTRQLTLAGGGKVGALLRDAAGRVWIGSYRGISVLAPDATAIKTIYRIHTPRQDAFHTSVRDFAQCPDGTLLAASSDGLLLIDDGGARRLGTMRRVTDVACDSRGFLFASSRRQVLRVDPDSGDASVLWQVPAQGEGVVTQIAVDPMFGLLWVAVRHTGVLKLWVDGSGSRMLVPTPNDAGGLPGRLFSRLLVDRSGMVWVGTTNRGVALTPGSGSAVQRFVTRDPARSNNVRALFQDQRGQLWVGTLGKGLQRFQPRDGSFVDASAALRTAVGREAGQPVSVHAIAASGDGTLWLASDHGVVRFEPAAGTARRLDLGKPADARDRYRDILVGDDGSLWLAGLDSGLVHFLPGQGVIARYTRADGLPDTHVVALERDGQGRLWVGTLRGLGLLDPASHRLRSFADPPERADSLIGARINDLHTDADGTLWVATDAGINKVLGIDAAGLHVERFTQRQGLPDNMAYCLLRDNQGKVWVSSNLGVAGLDLDSGKAIALTLADGLQGLEFNPRACLRDDHGNLWFGGINGLNKIMPMWMLPSRFLPPTVVTRVGFDDRPVALDYGQPLQVPAAVNVLRFSFASLDYKHPQSNRFQYRMVGVNDTWLNNGTSHHLAFTNLQPGHYRFEVRGSNHDGVFNPVPASLEVQVMPPWWATRAAHVAAAALMLLVIGLLLFAAWRRHATLLRHRQQLLEYERRLRLALWGSGDRFWDYDVQRERMTRIFGSPPGEYEPDADVDFDRWSHDSVHPEDVEPMRQRAQEHLDGHTDRFESEHRVRTKSGQWHWVRSRGQIVERNTAGEPLRMAGTTHDIERERAQYQQQEIATRVIQSMAEAVVVTDLAFRFISANPAFTHMFGYGQAELQGHDTTLLNGDRHTQGQYDHIRGSVRQQGRWRGELWQRRKDGEEFLSWLEINVVRDPEGNTSHYVSVVSDITERKRAEQELRYLANHDSLSGLPNRSLLRRRLHKAIRMAERMHTKVAVLFIDLDRFKQVNDAMGHVIGDRMLQAAGQRLRARAGRTDVVARLGGDEFGVVVENIRGPTDAAAAAKTLIQAFEQPLVLDSGQELLISPSIGIALYPDHASSPTELLKYADTAMYQAKSNGRNTWVVYTRAMEERARQQANMVAQLRKALANNELSLRFQPKLHIDSWRITGVEALARWSNPQLGDIPPAIFIPLAEDAGLISDIGEFVLNQACAVLHDWHRAGLEGLSMAINVSAAQLLNPKLRRQLACALEVHPVPADKLVFELTEGLVMARTEMSLHNLDALKASGATLAVDDFGTGYSSLAYLKRLPVDTLKIDKAFVSDIARDPDDEVITATIINIGHALGLDVIAEGVETFEQIVYLAGQGCDEIQGNWLSTPIAATDCLALIRAHRPGDKPRFHHSP